MIQNSNPQSTAQGLKHLAKIKEKAKKDKNYRVKIALTDIDGVLRGKYIHSDKFLSAASSSLAFCNVVFGWDIADLCYDHVGYTGWHTGYPDAQVCLALDTYREIPWEGQQSFFLADFIDKEAKALPICPRQVLKKQIRKAQEMGFTSLFGVELEWFNFKESPHSLEGKGHQNMEPLSPGMFGYSLLRSSYNHKYFHALFDQLLAFGIPLEGIHTETGPGVYEAAILASDPLEAADRAVLFKNAVKENRLPS